MKRLLLALLIVFIVSVSCLTPSATSTKGTAYDDTQDKKIAILEATVTGPNGLQAIVASHVTKLATLTASDTTALTAKVTSLESRLATAESKNVTLQQGLDAANSKITTLESWKASIGTGTGSGTTTPIPTTGTVSVTTNPTNIQVLGSTQICYTVRITNGTGQWVYARPIINVNLHTGQTVLSSALTAAAVELTIGGSVGSYVDADFSITGTTSSAVIIPTSGGSISGEIQIGAGSSCDLLVCIKITTTDPKIWDIGTSVNSRTL